MNSTMAHSLPLPLIAFRFELAYLLTQLCYFNL
jgi:hypothetical protein